ncbi:thiamine phosphate synthase [Tepidibacter thalassicus]|uniref:Thiamine-phosphate synthase n=1 Tax=Tepidibacter thalassicus DSM 15285 TaxID=1123350 RepID=A0A1M5NXG5_9FIRM|nr:thiamine phosphate synthase [Tepidibacter thalassicus]SHG94178.1 thiamine-phosphate pyrophosphorylase [Tepidibacter thalassicus DSM 15285]
MKDKLKLYLITDSNILRGRDFYKCIEDALKGGVRTVQLREKNCLGKEFLEKAYKLRELTKKYNALFIINDRVDIALLVDADGVHVGQKDIPVHEVRRLIGKNKILGVTAKTLQEAVDAEKYGANYLGVGAIFNTNTKLDAKRISINTLNTIRKNVNIPIVAIGGLKLNNINILKNNVDGYAVVSAILTSDDIYNESKKWIKCIC